MQAVVLELQPGTGLGPLKFGASREEARGAMAAIGFALESSHGNSDYFCENSIQAEYDTAGRVMFIGVACDSAFVARYRGVDAFAVTARELFQLAADADGSGRHEFDPLEYCFPNQVLTLWAADTQYDCRTRGTREVWGQVGLGNEVYVSAIKALDADPVP